MNVDLKFDDGANINASTRCGEEEDRIQEFFNITVHKSNTTCVRFFQKFLITSI